MSLQIVVVLSILVAAVILLVTEKFRPDLVALLVASALLLGEVLIITDALAGFSNPAVITRERWGNCLSARHDSAVGFSSSAVASDL
jgi:di/tricarboxylate transporter